MIFKYKMIVKFRHTFRWNGLANKPQLIAITLQCNFWTLYEEILNFLKSSKLVYLKQGKFLKEFLTSKK